MKIKFYSTVAISLFLPYLVCANPTVKKSLAHYFQARLGKISVIKCNAEPIPKPIIAALKKEFTISAWLFNHYQQQQGLSVCKIALDTAHPKQKSIFVFTNENALAPHSMVSDFCGTSGCTLLIYQPQGNSYKEIGDFNLHPPLLVSNQTTNNWRDLILVVYGGGISPTTIQLAINQKGRYGDIYNDMQLKTVKKNQHLSGQLLMPIMTQQVDTILGPLPKRVVKDY